MIKGVRTRRSKKFIDFLLRRTPAEINARMVEVSVRKGVALPPGVLL